MKIVLMGNPNVGKSVIFSRLTGVNVIASNYPGTTVEFTRGTMRFKGEKAELIDLPGAYTLEPTSRAEEVATRMLQEADLVINVVDATNLERNLNLTLHLIERGKPLVVALNMWDDARHRGIRIDNKKLQKLLGVPVIPTVGLTGEGIKELVLSLGRATSREAISRTKEERWSQIGEIISECQSLTHRHHTLLETVGDFTVKPLTGLPIALVVVYFTFKAIRYMGEGLIGYLFDPLFERFWGPMMMNLSSLLGSSGFLHDVLVGKLISGEIDFVQSFGLLTTGLYVPIAMVLPYVLSFYLVLGILEDLGYLPRLAILVDSLMHKVGLHGFASIPMILGIGCNVPGALATRVLETPRERFIAATLMAIAVPCTAQIAMIIGMLGEQPLYLTAVFGSLFLAWIGLGVLLNKVLKGESPEIFVEISPYRIPYWNTVVKKLWMRVREFLSSAIPMVLLGVLFMNILYSLGIINWIALVTAPVITGLLGLPREAVSALIIGFLRKDVAVGMLVPLNLGAGQLVVACVVLAMYFPCVATFVVLIRELGIKGMFKSTLIMLFSALGAGTILNLIF
ncbi:MAG: ferrous iron transporter B [Candidatus Latescibacteria bacterium]|nr:ferrous iron transporter B [Candidatus Latescibacterota bacterium]